MNHIDKHLKRTLLKIDGCAAFMRDLLMLSGLDGLPTIPEFRQYYQHLLAEKTLPPHVVAQSILLDTIAQCFGHTINILAWVTDQNAPTPYSATLLSDHLPTIQRLNWDDVSDHITAETAAQLNCYIFDLRSSPAADQEKKIATMIGVKHAVPFLAFVLSHPDSSWALGLLITDTSFIGSLHLVTSQDLDPTDDN